MLIMINKWLFILYAFFHTTLIVLWQGLNGKYAELLELGYFFFVMEECISHDFKTI